LVRRGRYAAAERWRQGVANYNRPNAERILRELAALEQAHGMRLRTIGDRIGERFVKPLDLDRLCALVRPAMEEAGRDEHPSFSRLGEELRAYVDAPSGVGLDVPHWLLRLEQEVQRFRVAHSPVAVLAELWLQIPSRPLAYDDLQRQLRDWETPLGG